jgi:hypothetical protein
MASGFVYTHAAGTTTPLASNIDGNGAQLRMPRKRRQRGDIGVGNVQAATPDALASHPAVSNARAMPD